MAPSTSPTHKRLGRIKGLWVGLVPAEGMWMDEDRERGVGGGGNSGKKSKEKRRGKKKLKNTLTSASAPTCAHSATSATRFAVSDLVLAVCDSWLDSLAACHASTPKAPKRIADTAPRTCRNHRRIDSGIVRPSREDPYIIEKGVELNKKKPRGGFFCRGTTACAASSCWIFKISEMGQDKTPLYSRCDDAKFCISVKEPMGMQVSTWILLRTGVETGGSEGNTTYIRR